MYKHFVITRFNLVYADSMYSVDKGGNKTQTNEWLDNRFRLFEEFCFPSLRNQKGKNFIWLVLFSINTPAPYKLRIEQYSKEFSCFKPAYFVDGGDNQKAIRDLVSSYLTDDDQYIITTRVDNDDSLHSDMTLTVQKAFDSQEDLFLNYDNGLQLDVENKILCEVVYPNNAFTSRIEKLSSRIFETVLAMKHIDIKGRANIEYIKTKPLWLQIIHGGNVSNTLKIKKLIFSKDILSDFNIAYDVKISRLASFSSYLLYNNVTGRYTKALRRLVKGSVHK